MKLNRFVFVKKNSTIFEAIENLNKNKLQGFVIVTNKKKDLIGTITDGDIRRAIIKKIDLNSRVELIMRRNPKYIDYKDKDNFSLIFAKFKKHKIRHLVIIKNKKINDLIVFDENNEDNLSKIPVVIMAGGEGKRMRPLTNKIPKPLIRIGKETIINRILKNLSANNFKNIFIIINYLGFKIKKKLGDGSKFGLKINYINEKKKLGTAGGLSLIKNFKYKNFILLNADILTNINYSELVKTHLEEKATFTISTVKYNYEVPYGIINRQTDKFNNLLEKPIFSHEINAGIYVLNSKVLKFIKRKYTDIDEVIKLLMKLKQKISVFPIYENWNELSRKKHLKNITEKFSYEK